MKFLSRLFLSLAVISLLYSCSTTRTFENQKVEFTGSVVFSEGKYLLPVPHGWFAADSSALGSLSFLFIKKDGNASISFEKINVSPELKNLTLKKIFHYEKTILMLERKNLKIIKTYSEKEKKETASFKSKNIFARLTVFKHGVKFFKSLLFCKGNPKFNSAVQDALIEKFVKLN